MHAAPEIDLSSDPEDTGISHLHLLFSREAGGYTLTDLGSTNGTFLNDKQVAKTARVRKGDQMQIGSTVLRAERA